MGLGRAHSDNEFIYRLQIVELGGGGEYMVTSTLASPALLHFLPQLFASIIASR